MNENEQNFDGLKKLLKLKQHEIPPPGYFNSFSDKVAARIRAGEISTRGSAYERIQSNSPWLAKFIAIFEVRPSLIGATATGLCLLLMLGVALTAKTEKAASGITAALVPDAADAAAPVMSLASVTAPLLADAGGGIQISTNPVSLQPMSAVFGQPSPLFQSVSFGH
jgi:hypothetical protein